MSFSFESLPFLIAQNLDRVYTFILLIARYGGLMMILPGIGGGAMGLTIRYPAIIILAGCGLFSSPVAQIPGDAVWLAVSIGFEFLFGMCIGLFPMAIVASAQLCGQLTSTSMGLQGAQLFDPTAGGQVPDLSRILGDLTVIVFLLVGGHYIAIGALAGLNEVMVPGTFVPTLDAAELLINRTGRIFELGLTLSLPVLVALLLAQFVMAVISRAVPTVNIFVVSFPITIGIGMLLTIFALPEILHVLMREMTGLENSAAVFLERSYQATPTPTPRFP